MASSSSKPSPKPEARYSWSNKCSKCNSPENIHVKHDPAKCCVICRNYQSIDKVARELSFENKDAWSGAQGPEHEKIVQHTTKVSKLNQQLEQDKQTKEETFKKHNEIHAGPYQKLKDDLDQKVTSQNLAVDRHNATQARMTAAQAKDPQKDTSPLQLELQKLRKEVKDLDVLVEDARKALLNTSEQLSSLENSHESAEARITQRKADIDTEVQRSGQLINKFAQSLLRKAKGAVDPTDSIDRARFFFAWVATSLTYDKKVIELSANLRGTAHTLVNKSEVCTGYAALFHALFSAPLENSAPSQKTLSSRFIGGHSKQSATDTQAISEGPRNNAHAWNAFQISNDGGKTIVTKLIDCTWGSGSLGPDTAINTNNNTSNNNNNNNNDNNNNASQIAKPRTLRTEWFTKSNKEFLRDHLPDNADHQFVDPRMSETDFWAQSETEVDTVSDKFLLDTASIMPRANPLDWKASQVFQFRRTCPHRSREKTPSFALSITTSSEPTFKTANLIWFTQEITKGEEIWSADVKLMGDHANADKVILLSFFEKVAPGASGQSAPAVSASKPVAIYSLEELKKYGQDNLQFNVVYTWTRRPANQHKM